MKLSATQFACGTIGLTVLATFPDTIRKAQNQNEVLDAELKVEHKTPIYTPRTTLKLPMTPTYSDREMVYRLNYSTSLNLAALDRLVPTEQFICPD